MKGSTIFEVDSNIVVTNLTNLYNRSETSFNEDATTLKEWMKTQPHLPEILSEKVIRNFLIRSKCSVEKAKQRIDMYYTIRSQIPDFFEDINPKCDRIQLCMQGLFWIPLPKLVEEKYRVFVFKIRDRDVFDKTLPIDGFRYLCSLMEIRMIEDSAFGEIAVIDLEDVGYANLLKATPVVLAKFFSVYEKVFSIPLKGMYLINSPSFASTVVGILKQLLKPKLFQRVHVCKDASVLEEHFDDKILPRDYGGEGKSLQEIQDLVQQKFVQYQDRFDLLDRLRVDESLRPEELKNDETSGFYGNFKKLDLD